MKKLFSLLALVGVIAACQPEKLETAFEVADAVAKITVTTVDLKTGQNVNATITASEGSVSGNVVTITGNPAITARVVTVTATYEGNSNSQSVQINSLLAGGAADYGVIITVGSVIDNDREFSYVETASESVEEVKYLTSDSHEPVNHDGKMWFKNLSEFYLTGSVNWTSYSGAELVSVDVINEDYKSVVEAYADAYDQGIVASEKVLDITVSAWAYYTVSQTRTTTVKTFEVKADDEKIGEFVVKMIESSEAEYEEIANPEGHGHYHAGHGHGHGGDNAGGGIVWGE